jgi:hypothetical protein
MKSFTPPTSDVVDLALRSMNRDVDRSHFYTKLENPHWVVALEERKAFKDPPPPIRHDDNSVQWPGWPELAYVLRVTPLVPLDAVRVASSIPENENPRVYHQILEIALALKNPELSVRLLGKMIEYADLEYHIIEAEFAPLLRQWAVGGQAGIEAAVKLAKHLLRFKADPREKEKKDRKKRDPSALFTGLEPVPRYDEHDYVTILNEGIVPLGITAPLETGKVLVEAISDMIRLKRGLKRVRADDYVQDGSIAWCREVDQGSSPHSGPDEILVRSLTKVLSNGLMNDQSGTLADSIFSMLLSAKWPVFKRIGDYLAAQKPQVASTWIKRSILEHEDYAVREYGREFAEMVRNATQPGNPHLFGEAELTPIFDAILSGPNKQRFAEWMGKDFTEEEFARRQTFFHKAQLWPFESMLFGKYKDYFNRLTSNESPSLEQYGPRVRSLGESRFVSSTSPISKEDLGSKSDEDLIRYLNDWNDAHHTSQEWWIEIDHRGLSQAFQEVILANPERFATWDSEWTRIDRPIHLRAAIDAATKIVETKNLRFLKAQLRLALYLAEKKSGSEAFLENLSTPRSASTPDWEYARQGAEAFLEGCLKKENDVPQAWRATIGQLLTILCTGYDSILDENREVFVGSYDPIGTAINTTRGRALQRITDFVNWVEFARGPGAFAQVPEITGVLARRFANNPTLTEPEYGILGETFNRFFYWDRNWAVEHLRDLFPRDLGLKHWRAAFHSYLRFSSVYGDLYDSLKDDYLLGLAHIDLFRNEAGDYNTPAEAIGHHLFSFYATGRFELADTGNPLATFLDVASVEERAGLIAFIGRSLTSHPDTPSEPTKRCQAYFEARLSKVEQAANQVEADEFALFEPWMTATVLDPKWRLAMTNRVLKLPLNLRGDWSIVKGLAALLPAHVPQVLECFSTLIGRNVSKRTFYIDRNEASAIIRAGLESTDVSQQNTARKIQDDLLRAGHLEYLSLSD